LKHNTKNKTHKIVNSAVYDVYGNLLAEEQEEKIYFLILESHNKKSAKSLKKIWKA
jgi:DNA replication initiation complex subunit (GINS family)